MLPAPRADPGVRLSRTGLLSRVMAQRCSERMGTLLQSRDARGATPVTSVVRLRVRRLLCRPRSPRSGAFPPPPPPPRVRLCSAASTVLCTRPTPHARASSAMLIRASRRDPAPPWRLRVGMRPPRFRRDPCVRDVVFDPGRAAAPRDDGTAHVAFDHVHGLGLCDIDAFVAQ